MFAHAGHSNTYERIIYISTPPLGFTGLDHQRNSEGVKETLLRTEGTRDFGPYKDFEVKTVVMIPMLFLVITPCFSTYDEDSIIL